MRAQRVWRARARMEKMAVNSRVPWRSLNLIDSEYAEQEHSELFQNLEKLIASAVSICRLDGSLQCQIGGLITVIEELQRLLRHSFSEIKRLERTLDYQKQNISTSFSDLHKQVKDIQSNASKCIPNDTISSVPMSPRETPRSSLNDGNDSLSVSKNVLQQTNTNEQSDHVCLVDESYGNEEEDDNSIPNNVNGQPEVQEARVFLIDNSIGGSVSVDAEVEGDADVEGGAEVEGDDKNDVSLNEAVSSQNTVVGNISEESTDTSVFSSELTSPTTCPVGITWDANEETEIVTRILRRSKAETDSKVLEIMLPRRQSRSQNLPRSARIAKSNAISVMEKNKTTFSTEKTRRRATVEFVRRNAKEMNRDRRKTVSGSGKASSKTPVEISGKRSLSKNNTKEPKVVDKRKAGKNDALMKETKGKRSGGGSPVTKPSVAQAAFLEKPMDRYINFDFLLMANQIMSELVTDSRSEEAALDQVKESQRNNVVKLARLYRLRVRMAEKIEGDLPMVLVKGRESSLPKPGEVDVLLSTMSDKKPAGLSKKTRNKRKIDAEKHSLSNNKNSGSKSKKKKKV